jgi:hypothetical protein
MQKLIPCRKLIPSLKVTTKTKETKHEMSVREIVQGLGQLTTHLLYAYNKFNELACIILIEHLFNRCVQHYI